MENKVWVVELSEGVYEMYRTWIHGIYTSEEQAVEAAKAVDEANKNAVEEFESLPFVMEDEYGNPLNMAQLICCGSGIEGDEYEFGAVVYNYKNSDADTAGMYTVIDDHMAIKKSFLEKYNISKDEAEHYINLHYLYNHNCYDSPGMARIFSYNLNESGKAGIKHPVYNGINNPTNEK